MVKIVLSTGRGTLTLEKKDGAWAVVPSYP